MKTTQQKYDDLSAKLGKVTPVGGKRYMRLRGKLTEIATALLQEQSAAAMHRASRLASGEWVPVETGDGGKIWEEVRTWPSGIMALVGYDEARSVYVGALRNEGCRVIWDTISSGGGAPLKEEMEQRGHREHALSMAGRVR